MCQAAEVTRRMSQGYSCLFHSINLVSYDLTQESSFQGLATFLQHPNFYHWLILQNFACFFICVIKIVIKCTNGHVAKFQKWPNDGTFWEVIRKHLHFFFI